MIDTKVKGNVLSALILLFSCAAFSQGAAINSTGAIADASAMLDVSSSSQGILIPRVTLTTTSSSSPVANPANSLMVYNTATVNDVTPGFYYWSGSEWQQLVISTSLNADLRAIKTKLYTNIGGH